MLNSKRSYTQEFKQEAVALLESSGQSAAAIERELGITPGLLSRWRRNQKAAGQPTNGQRKETGKRIQELERENARLYQEREILKKVVAIFAPRNERGLHSWKRIGKNLT